MHYFKKFKKIFLGIQLGIKVLAFAWHPVVSGSTEKNFQDLPSSDLSYQSASQDPSKKQVLKVGVSPDYPPFEFYQEGKLTGFDVDLALEIGKILGKEVIFQALQFNAILFSLEQGNIDVGISSFAITPERQKNFDFSTPYYHDKTAAVFKKSHPVDSIEALKKTGTRIGCLLGSIQANWVKNECPNAIPLSSKRDNEAIEALKAGHVQVVLTGEAQAASYVRTNENLAFKVLFQTDEGFGIVLSKNNPLRQKINEALQILKNNGTLKKLEEKWIHGNKKNILQQGEGWWGTLKNRITYWFLTFCAVGKGVALTLQLLIGGMVLGLILGILLSVLRYMGKGRRLIEGYISLVRGTPLILQITFIHLCIPQWLGVSLSLVWAGILSFGLNSAAYVAEIIRSGLNQVPKAQFEAAKSLLIKPFYQWKDIIFPQIFRNIFPSLINEVTSLLKETALISVIGGVDIMRQAENLALEKFTYFAPLVVATLYYYGFVLAIEWIGKKLYKKIDYLGNKEC